ncbi:MAG TPA: outer membrane protein assembly factor BamD [Bacteroidota bacterium]|nr:outer membrane protein assembly factor BamD [Bacteroidota bacterium]
MRFIPIMAILVVLFSSCSRKSAEQLYSEGVKAEAEQQFPVAIERYSELIDRFQQTAVAESALYRSALIYSNDAHDIPKAIASYQRYYRTYPSSPHAPSALFLAGFLWNNDQHNLDSAKAAYQLFLTQYPSHELASSAKFELDNLGKDPSQLTPSSVKGSGGSPPAQTAAK